MDDVYGVWYGVGYAQHNPDMTNVPNKVGCVTLYISDATQEFRDNWFGMSIMRRNYSDQNWRSSRSNPWSENSMSGSWLDVRLKRKAKRNFLEDQNRVRVLWDEDGHTLEQVYLYYPEEPGLWTVERLRPMEKELMSRGIDVWYPDDPPRHPDVIRLLKVTQYTLVLNHCSEIGNGGIFSLILRRSPSKVQRWEWFGETNGYSTYTTTPSIYNQNQYPYKTNYGTDIATYPEATRYPNMGYSTPNSNVFNTASSGSFYQNPSYTTPNYGYGQGYNRQNFNQGMTSYEMPFFKYNEDYCVDRSPQNSIWVNSLMGMWYGVEFIQHLAGDARVDYGRTCIVIHISEPRDRSSTPR
ncbi:unnamed protein product, partial [Brenthis ino]